jgi:N-acetylglucosamine malate deacetylase 1
MNPPMRRRTLLVGLAHPDDELGVAGTILAQRARGDRVVLLWLSRGEMTEAMGPLPTREVARRREEQGRRAGEILGVETRFLEHQDTRIEATRAAAEEVARLIAEIRPDGLLTWGHAWVRGMRHPDHAACGQIFRDAVTLARLAKVVEPVAPHRAPVPVFTIRDVHSSLPAVAVDVSPHVEGVLELASHYLEGVGFGDHEFFVRRMRLAGEQHGLDYAEVLDAWESPGGVVSALLPAGTLEGTAHPERPDELPA